MLPINRSKKQAQRYYDRLSKIYNWLTSSEQALIKKGVQRLAPNPRERILEIGCGTGTGLAKIAQRMNGGGQLVGLDLSFKMLEKSKHRLDSAQTPCFLVENDAVQLPLKTNALDGVYCAFTLELFSQDEIKATLHEIRRVLRPEGRIVVVSLSGEPHNLMARLYELGHRLFPVALDCRPIPTRTILENAGFRIIDAHKFMNWGLPVDMILARE